MSYTNKTISGFSWQTLLKLATAGITVLKTAIVARVLTPEDFGVFALVVIALGLVEASTQTGINITLIQSKKPISYYLDTAWVIAIVRGALIAVLMIFLSFALQPLYNQPNLITFISIAALVPFIKGFINPYLVSFRKELEFFREAVFRLTILTVETIAAVALVLWYPTVVSLILALICSAVAEVILSFVYFKEWPKFKFSKDNAKDIFAHTADLGIASVMNYLHENGDDFIVGKMTNTFTLGLYHNAYSLGHKITYELGKSLHHGLFPVIAQFSEDTDRIKRALLRSLTIFSLIVWTMSLPLFFFPKQVVLLVLGEQWTEISASVPWLTFAGIIQSYATVGYSFLMARKKFKLMNIHIFASIVLLCIFLLLLIPSSGLLGAAQAVALSRLLTLPLLIWAVLKAISK